MPLPYETPGIMQVSVDFNAYDNLSKFYFLYYIMCNAKCFKKSFTLVFQILLCSEWYKNLTFQGVERWIVCNVFLTLATQ
jgi:hypothetical protein